MDEDLAYAAYARDRPLCDDIHRQALGLLGDRVAAVWCSPWEGNIELSIRTASGWRHDERESSVKVRDNPECWTAGACDRIIAWIDQKTAHIAPDLAMCEYFQRILAERIGERALRVKVSPREYPEHIGGKQIGVAVQTPAGWHHVVFGKIAAIRENPDGFAVYMSDVLLGRINEKESVVAADCLF
jgi:hypothetical protein